MQTLMLVNFSYANGMYRGHRRESEPLSDKLLKAILATAKPVAVQTEKRGRIPVGSGWDGGQWLDELHVTRGGDGKYRASGVLVAPDGGGGFTRTSFSDVFDHVDGQNGWRLSYAPFA